MVVFRSFAVEHPSLFKIGIQLGLTPDPGLAAGFSGEQGEARAGLAALVERLDLAGDRFVLDTVTVFHALCEGLAAIELRGLLPSGRERNDLEGPGWPRSSPGSPAGSEACDNRTVPTNYERAFAERPEVTPPGRS